MLCWITLGISWFKYSCCMLYVVHVCCVLCVSCVLFGLLRLGGFWVSFYCFLASVGYTHVLKLMYRIR